MGKEFNFLHTKSFTSNDNEVNAVAQNSEIRDLAHKNRKKLKPYDYESCTSSHKVVFVDFETNGFSNTSVLQICATKGDFIDGDLINRETLNRYYFPTESFNHQASKHSHKLTTIFIEKERKNCNYPKHFKDDIEIVDFFSNINKFVAHNVKFDYPILKTKREISSLFCTMDEFRKKKLGKWNLGFVLEHYNIDYDKNKHHNALYDVERTIDIFIEMFREKNENVKRFLEDNYSYKISKKDSVKTSSMQKLEQEDISTEKKTWKILLELSKEKYSLEEFSYFYNKNRKLLSFSGDDFLMNETFEYMKDDFIIINDEKRHKYHRAWNFDIESNLKKQVLFLLVNVHADHTKNKYKKIKYLLYKNLNTEDRYAFYCLIRCECQFGAFIWIKNFRALETLNENILNIFNADEIDKFNEKYLKENNIIKEISTLSSKNKLLSLEEYTPSCDTEKVYLEYFKNETSVDCLHMVPSNCMTRKVCEQALCSNILNIRDMPSDFITQEMTLVYLEQLNSDKMGYWSNIDSLNFYSWIEYLPMSMRTNENLSLLCKNINSNKYIDDVKKEDMKTIEFLKRHTLIEERTNERINSISFYMKIAN